MKLVQKSVVMINQKQLIVFKVALFQILLGLLMLFLLSRCTSHENKPTTTAQNAAQAKLDSAKKKAVPVDPNYIAIASYYSEDIKQKLRDLEQLKFEQGTLGNQVLDYLKKGENDFGDDFKFIDLRFERRDAIINDRFAHEIKDLAAIMAQFPSMKIKLMVYTDNVGGEKANDILSENRAKEVQKRLVAAGVTEDRIMTKAYGQKFPVGDNKIFDGQLINNRIELKILSK